MTHTQEEIREYNMHCNGGKVRRTNNPCTKCGEPGIPAIVKGAGKCSYHWTVGVWGRVWADECVRRSKQ